MKFSVPDISLQRFPDFGHARLSLQVTSTVRHTRTAAALIQDQPSVMAGIVKVALTMRHCVP